jgi:rRNA-processing protein FCF1
MIVLMDTNALTMPRQFGIDVFAEAGRLVPGAEFATVGQVVSELEALEDRQAARLALGLIRKFGVKVLREAGNADDALLRAAKRRGAAVCTNDAGLRKRCLEAGVPVLCMRKKRMLEYLR